MTNSYDVDHGLSQCPPGPLEPVEIAQQDDTLARTGNTARDQEMYVAGIRTGEENTKHNAAIRAGVPDGFKLVPIEPTNAMVVEGVNAGLKHRDEPYFIYAAMINASPAAPGVSTVEEDGTTPGATWREKGEADPHGTRYNCERAALTLGILTDDELANGAFLAYDRQPSVDELLSGKGFTPIVWMTAVKDRIRWLSRKLAEAEVRPAPAAGDALDALRELVECDNIKKRIASMQGYIPETEDDVQELDAMMSDLARRQPAAWNAARAALIAQRKGDA